MNTDTIHPGRLLVFYCHQRARHDGMKQPGTTFVAVGAGHLAGPDSLQKQLEKLGIEVQRQ